MRRGQKPGAPTLVKVIVPPRVTVDGVKGNAPSASPGGGGSDLPPVAGLTSPADPPATALRPPVAGALPPLTEARPPVSARRPPLAPGDPLQALIAKAASAANQTSLGCQRGVMGLFNRIATRKRIKVHARSCHAAAHWRGANPHTSHLSRGSSCAPRRESAAPRLHCVPVPTRRLDDAYTTASFRPRSNPHDQRQGGRTPEAGADTEERPRRK